MDVNFNDVESIRAWIRVAPERHEAQIAGFKRLPLFAMQLAETRRVATLSRRSPSQPQTAGADPSAPTAAGPGTGPTPAPSASQGALL